jgi:putative transcriptional regulator
MNALTRHERPKALEAALKGYAAGSLPRALHALVGAHLELSCENRDFVAALEGSLASKDLMGAAPCEMRAGSARLAAILEQEPLAREKCCRDSNPGWPRALRHYMGEEPEKLPFRTLLPGISECRLSGDENAEALLYKVRGGKTIPEHVHMGEEFTLVLSGALLDRGQRYCPGDVNIGDDSVQHAPVAAPGQECICFVVLTGPLRLTGTIGRLFNRFMKN